MKVTLPQQQFEINPRLCFVVMTFDKALNNLYRIIKTTLEEKCGMNCLRADELSKPELITDDIVKSINEARFLIADLTASKANVFYEVGYAHALGKPVILLAQANQIVPFDLQGIRYIIYDPNDLSSLEQNLFQTIKQCISTIPQNWHNSSSNSEQTYIKITSLETYQSILLGHEFKITVKARNVGFIEEGLSRAAARVGYFSVSFPDGVDNLSITSSIDTTVGLKGDRWMGENIILDYPIAEGSEAEWLNGQEYQITVRGYAKRKGLLWFYVSASCLVYDWKFDPEERILDVDQRGENVYCGVIDVI